MIENFSKEELTNEQWRDVDGYDGVYQVSDLGRVRSKKYGDWRVMKSRKTNWGYLMVGLWKDGKQKKLYVHRLVASAFIENNNILNDQVNHRNEDKTDNRAENLEWCTASYNLSYNGLRKRRKQPKPYIHHRPLRDEIRPFYNPNLSINENLELFKSNGIECCRHTVCKLRKDLGLSKPRKKTN